MRKTVLCIIVAVFGLCAGIAPSIVTAQPTDSLIVTAEVVDFEAIADLSTVDVNPSVLPVGGPSLITVTVRGTGGTPRAGETVLITFNALHGVPGAVTIVQPSQPTDSNGQTFAYVSSSVAGIVEIFATVTTYDDDIPIDDSESVLFEPVSVPVMKAEPQFTQGFSNEVAWTGNSLIYDFEVMIATDVGFTEGVHTSLWLSENDYTFNSLVDGQIYYYKVRARNAYGIVGEWSNVVYSIQDGSPPWSTVASMDVTETGFTFHVTANDSVSGIDFVRMFVNRNGEGWEEFYMTDASDFSRSFGDVLGGNPLNWNGTVCFYSQAVDRAGNEEPFAPGSNGDGCVEVEGEPGGAAEPGDPEEPDEGDDEEPGEEPGDEGPEDTPIDEIQDAVENAQQYLEYGWGNIIDFLAENEESSGSMTAVLLSIPVATGAMMVFTAFGFSLVEVNFFISELFVNLGSYFGMSAKRRKWGVVYDSVTKDPVPRAVVRLFMDRKLLQTVVTDVEGVFSFPSVKRGTYRLTVDRNGFIFPSQVILGSSDGLRSDIYRGGEYEITSDDQLIRINIPIDPLETTVAKRLLLMFLNLMSSLLMFLLPVLMLVGIVFSFVCYILWAKPLYLILGFLNLIMFFWYLYGSYNGIEKWGKVVDIEGERLAHIPLGLFDRTYGRMLDERVTDEFGKYRFIIKSGEYLLRPLTKNHVIADAEFVDGYPVGKQGRGDIIVARKVVLRPAQAQ